MDAGRRLARPDLRRDAPLRDLAGRRASRCRRRRRCSTAVRRSRRSPPSRRGRRPTNRRGDEPPRRPAARPLTPRVLGSATTSARMPRPTPPDPATEFEAGRAPRWPGRSTRPACGSASPAARAGARPRRPGGDRGALASVRRWCAAMPIVSLATSPRPTGVCDRGPGRPARATGTRCVSARSRSRLAVDPDRRWRSADEADGPMSRGSIEASIDGRGASRSAPTTATPPATARTGRLDAAPRPARAPLPIDPGSSNPTVPKVDMPGTERTLVLVKPDGVQRQLVGRILARYEERGLKLVGLKLIQVDPAPRRAALRRPPREAVLRRARRLHHSAPLVAAGLRGPERDRRRPGDQRGDPAARGGAGHDPRRLRARDRAEHRPRVGQPRGGRLRARALVPARRAPRLRARGRPLGARPERVAGGHRAARFATGSTDLDRRGRFELPPDRSAARSRPVPRIEVGGRPAAASGPPKRAGGGRERRPPSRTASDRGRERAVHAPSIVARATARPTGSARRAEVRSAAAPARLGAPVRPASGRSPAAGRSRRGPRAWRAGR